MTDAIEVPEGTASDISYLVQYNEDLWYELPEETREYCKETWIKKAAPCPGVKWVVLRLVPDALFPMRGHESPYIHWQTEIERGPKKTYVIHTEHTIHVTGFHGKYLDPMIRSEITLGLANMPRGFSYSIVNANNELLEAGRY